MLGIVDVSLRSLALLLFEADSAESMVGWIVRLLERRG